jgi:hypothetical protein
MSKSTLIPLNHQRPFSLRDILQIQDTQGDITTPDLFLSANPRTRTAVVDVELPSGDIVIQVDQNVRRLVKGGLTEKEWRQKVGAVRHDFVANELTEDTDEPLSKLGINSTQTPDCIDSQSRSVLELATSASNESKSLKSSWLSKRITYYDRLMKHNVKYFILIVSTDRILFNGEIDDNTVEDLCERCRLGIDIENQICQLTGMRLNLDSDAQYAVKELRSALKQISELELKESRGFKKELMSESHRDNTEMEDIHVAEIMRKTLEKSMRIKPQTPDSVISDYVNKMREFGTKKDLKRVVNFPVVISRRFRKDMKPESADLGVNINCPSEIYKIASNGTAHVKAKSRGEQHSVRIMSKSEAISGISQTEQHKMRRVSEFTCPLTEEEQLSAALSGIRAKALSSEAELIEKEANSKVSFDPDTNTEDIQQFLTSGEHEDSKPYCGDYRSPSTAMTSRAKRRVDHKSKSLDIYQWASQTVITSFAQSITDILTEVSYEYKIPHKFNRFSLKWFPNYSAFVIIQATGTHTHCFFGFEKQHSKILDKGRLGPTLWETQNYYISDWSSYTEVALEHLVKAGPYIKGILCYLLKHFRVPIYTEGIYPPSELWTTANSLLLVYLNNKVDLEELITANRYLHMRALQHFEADVMQFVERLPEVCRSRLTVYFLNKTINLMRYYQERKPYRRKMRTKKTQEEPGFEELNSPGTIQTEYVYFRLRCIFHEQPVSIEQLVDSFYFGYVVSKTKGRAGDRSFKIVAKICKEHFWFKDNIVDPGVMIWQLLKEPKRHCWDHALARRLTDLWIEKMIAKYGISFRSQLHNKIEETLARKTFLDIATLKASSKDHMKVTINLNPSDSRGKRRVKEIREDNPQLLGKRPRVITALSRLIREYMKVTGDREPTYPKLLVYCCEVLHQRGWVYSDLFPKDQHGGDREIHVIEIKARIIHFAVESVSRTTATFMPSDSIGDPGLKDRFMTTHERKATAVLGEHITLCKSADASKWCQRHHVSKFFFVMSRITKGTDIPYLMYLFFWLWTEKRIAIPEDLVDIIEGSRNTVSSNPTFKRLGKSFWEGSDPFVKKSTNLIKIEDGMFQGLPHLTSTVIHGGINESVEVNCTIHLSELGIDNVSSVIQGSDDSAMCISIKKSDRKSLLWVQACLKWKENVAEYMSIWTSEAKSSIGTINLMEYNSEWWVDGKVVRPTFRWVSASLTVSLTETFYERIQTFYDLTTQCLESGAYTLTCSLLQMCQSEMHYKMLGLDNHPLGREMCERIEQACHPAVGYFPLEMDYNCGITGFDFMMYYYAKKGWTSIEENDWDMINPRCQLEYDDQLDRTLRESLRTVELRFGSTKLHKQVVEESGLSNITASVALLERDPEVLYTDKGGWQVVQAKLTAKLFDRGVKSSLSSYQPTIRSFVSSSYMINRPCFVVSSKVTGLTGSFQNKYTLWQVAGFYAGKKKNDGYSPSDLRKVFLKYEEYEEGFLEIQRWQDQLRTVHSNIKSRGKVEFIVWESKIPLDFELLDIVRRKWFGHHTIKLSSSVFKELWSRTKAHYSFLKDTQEETSTFNRVSPMVLRNLLERVEGKARKLKLVDTSAKQKTLTNIMSRILWPKVKVLHKADTPLSEVKRILNDLYLLASSPISDEVKTSLCSNVLMNEETLRIKDVDLPKRLLRLKVISEYLSWRNKEQVLLRITNLKLGVLGYFIQRQESVMEFTTDIKGRFKQVKKNVNIGEWHGLVDGISVVMKMTGNVCNNITVSRFVDPMSLGSSLMNLVREFRLVAPESFESERAQIYLDDRSNFSVFQGKVRNLIPILLNKELEDPVSDKLLWGKWHLRVQNMTLRLKVAIRDHMGMQKEVTILNYSLRSTDWQPNSRFSVDVYDLPGSMMSWLRGETADLHQLMTDIEVGNNWIKMSQLLARLRTEKKDVIINMINVNALVISVQKNIVKRVSDLRRAQKVRLQAMMKHYKEDEKDIFIQNFKADKSLMNAFVGMSQDKSWTESIAEDMWGPERTVAREDDPIHRELVRLQEARAGKPWDADSDDEGSVVTVGSDFLKDGRAMDDNYLKNQITSQLDEEILENIRELFLEQEETFQMIDERELVTADIVPPAIVFFQSIRSHLALEKDHAEISKHLTSGDIDKLKECKYTGQAAGIMSLACNRNFLAQLHKSSTEDDGIPASTEGTDSVSGSKPELSVSTARGREVYMSDEELKKEQEYLTVMLGSAPETMKYDLELILRRIASELNYRSTAFKPLHMPNIKSSEFLKLITARLLQEDEEGPIKSGRTEEEKKVLTKVYIRDRCDFLDSINAINSSHIHSIMASLDHDRVNNHLVEAGAVAIERNIRLVTILQGEVTEIFETRFPFMDKLVTLTCNSERADESTLK